MKKTGLLALGLCLALLAACGETEREPNVQLAERVQSGEASAEEAPRKEETEAEPSAGAEMTNAAEETEASEMTEPSKPSEGLAHAGVSDAEILNAYWAAYGPHCAMEELSVLRVGEFGGCEAVFVNGPFAYATVITVQTVDGLRFEFSTSQTVLLYRDGEICTLPEAWQAGWLDRSALEALHGALPHGSRYEVK